MPRFLRPVVGLLLLCGFWGPTAPAHGRTIAVPGDSPTIKGAMIQARPGDIVLVACGTYREFDIQVKPGVSLWSGTLQPDCATIDAGGQGRCLLFANADSTTRVAGFTLRGGRADRGGAVLCEDSSPVLSRCRFRDNTADLGGALAATGTVGPRLELCGFRDNEAIAGGGAVFWTAGGGELVACSLVANNAALAGGALAARGGALTIDRSLIADNHAGSAGGAAHLDGTRLVMTGTVVSDNRGGLAGGAFFGRKANVRLIDCTLHGNDTDGDGTVLSLQASPSRLESCLVTGSAGALVESDGSAPLVHRTNIYGPAGGWPALLAAQRNAAGNLAADPLYCAPATGDFHLRAGSPCLGGSGAGSIGALGPGCGAPFPPDVLD